MANINNTPKIGFFWQSANNPCAVKMNLNQIQKVYPTSPVAFWEDLHTPEYDNICYEYKIEKRNVYRIGDDNNLNRIGASKNLVSTINFLNRIYISLMTTLKNTEWFFIMEDDVWVVNEIVELDSKLEWIGGLGREWPEEVINNGTPKGVWCAAGGTLIKREAFLDAYMKVQDIDWNLENELLNRALSYYTDVAISMLLAKNGVTWRPHSYWQHWIDFDSSAKASGFSNIIHNVKYWYNHPLDKLTLVNSSEEVSKFLGEFNGH